MPSEKAKNLKVGQVVYRGFRFWVDLSFFLNGVGYPGWNTTFVPYRIVKITAKCIKIQLLPDSINGEVNPTDKRPLFLDRARIEQFRKQYHTRFHEYFYVDKPKTDPEHKASARISILNLPALFTADDVNREYKKLARKVHPDAGGTDALFIELQQARDAALRLTMPA